MRPADETQAHHGLLQNRNPALARLRLLQFLGVMAAAL